MNTHLEQFNPEGKKVLVRCEFDVPVEGGVVTETKRIEEGIPTIQYLIGKGAKVIIISHRGRPEGYDNSFSLAPCVPVLERLLHKSIAFIPAILGPQVESAVASLQAGDVLLLENLRFEKGEEEKSEALGKSIASLADAYVNESFSVAHRDHMSISLLPTLLPAYAGLHLQAEFDNLNKAVRDIERPFVFIFGGKKADTKLKILPDISKLADHILLGGTMFMEDFATMPNIVVPEDIVIAKQVGSLWEQKTVLLKDLKLEDGWGVYDIGPLTVKKYQEFVRSAKTVAWNGPVGWFEQPDFVQGTKEIAQMLAFSQAFTITGGGDTIAAINKFKLFDKFSFVSSGGGAMLEFLAGKKLPGLAALGFYK